MKERYIRQVKRELRLPRKAKAEVLRDLKEIFTSAEEHGETAQQVIARLGTPKEFAGSIRPDAAQSAAGKGRASAIASAAVAVTAFGIYAAAAAAKAPRGAIGQADAMTNIQIEGAFGLDMLQILLALGVIAAVFVAAQFVRTARSGREPWKN